MSILGAKHNLMAVSSKKGDILFAVSALSDRFFDSEEDVHNYTRVIEDYFADSETETETDNECGMQLYNNWLLFTDCKQILRPNSRLQLTVRKLVYVVTLMMIMRMNMI